MKNAVVAYLSSLVTMVGLDAVWLTLTGKSLYRAHLGDLMAPGFSLPPAALFYLVYVVGIVVFAVQPAIASGRVGTAALRGALLGLVAYAAYDLTNQATLHDWPMVVTVADLCWGTALPAWGIG